MREEQKAALVFVPKIEFACRKTKMKKHLFISTHITSNND